MEVKLGRVEFPWASGTRRWRPASAASLACSLCLAGFPRALQQTPTEVRSPARTGCSSPPPLAPLLESIILSMLLRTGPFFPYVTPYSLCRKVHEHGSPVPATTACPAPRRRPIMVDTAREGGEGGAPSYHLWHLSADSRRAAGTSARAEAPGGQEQRDKEKGERGGRKEKRGGTRLSPLRRRAAEGLEPEFPEPRTRHWCLSRQVALYVVGDGKGRRTRDEDSWTVEQGRHRPWGRARAGAGAGAGGRSGGRSRGRSGRTALPESLDPL